MTDEDAGAVLYRDNAKVAPETTSEPIVRWAFSGTDPLPYAEGTMPEPEPVAPLPLAEPVVAPDVPIVGDVLT